MQASCLEDQRCEPGLKVLLPDLWVATYFKVETETASRPDTREQAAFCLVSTKHCSLTITVTMKASYSNDPTINPVQITSLRALKHKLMEMRPNLKQRILCGCSISISSTTELSAWES